MGGIDLLDSCTTWYKFSLKARRWYMYIFWHFIQLAVINGWLWYRHDCKQLGIEKPLILRKFQGRVASGLVSVNAARKRGRPAAELSPSSRPTSPVPHPPRKARLHPNKDARKDQYAHWPVTNIAVVPCAK